MTKIVMVLTMVVVATVMTLVLMVIYIRASWLGWVKTDGFVKRIMSHDHSAGMVVMKG